MAIAPDGTPYVAYRAENDYKATVMKYTPSAELNDVQIITPDIIPDRGTYYLNFDEHYVQLNYDSTSAEIQDAMMVAMDGYYSSNIAVSGDMLSSMTIEFKNERGNKPRPLITLDTSNLFNGTTQVNPTVEKLQTGKSGREVV